MDRAHEALAELLRRSRHRYTRGRRQLVDALLEAGRPLTVRELLDGGRSLSVSSTYRNLSILEACGAVRRISSVGDDGVRYELHESLTGHHHHLGCSVCGQLIDFVLPDEVESALSLATQEAQRVAGFIAQSHRLELVGTCRSCA